MKKRKKVIKYIFLFLFILFLCSLQWAILNFGGLSMDKIIFHMKGEAVSATERGIIIKYLVFGLLPSIIIFLLIYFILNLKMNNEYILKIKFYKKDITKVIKPDFFKKTFKYILTIFSIVATILLLHQISFFEYIRYQCSNSKYIEANYINPADVSVTFPEQKKNLITIYVESLESSFFYKDMGKSEPTNLMPEIYALSQENTNFSHNADIGGAQVLTGTGWTTGALTAETMGIPLKMDGLLVNYSKVNSFLPGGYGLGEILEQNGYRQEMMFGSEKVFGNKGVLFEKHGNYKVFDYNTAVKQHKISKDYKVWWGFEDSKLFEYAKEEITNMAAQEGPFHFSMLTANTHHPDGYLESECDAPYDVHYANVVSCTSRQLYDFIEWLKDQPFYDNTTIVILGDHYSMKTDFFTEEEEKNRRVLNIYINSVLTPKNNTNREFSTLDYFPTTLAALGATIDGDMLGLGINLYSDNTTILEEHGYDYVDKEFTKQSKFYIENIIKNKEN